MNTQSESISELSLALSKAQGEFPAIEKGKTANAGKYQYRYADLGDVISTLKPILVKHGLSVVQSPMVSGERQYLVTQLQHSSGEWIRGMMFLPPLDDPQKLGGLFTYYRRYSLCAILGCAAEEDTDAAHVKDQASLEKAGRIQAKLEAAPSPFEESENPADIQDGPDDAGAYVVQIGKKYAGQRLDRINKSDLLSYANYFIEQQKKTGKPHDERVSELLNMIDQYTHGRVSAGIELAK